jgi:hypothetical protein
MERALRKLAQPFEIFGGELFARPKRCQAGHGIKFLDIHEAADGPVVIAANENLTQRLRFGNHFVGIAAIAHGVSEIDDKIISRRSGQAGVERFKVTVNVAENKDTHRGRIIAQVSGVRCQVSGKAGLDSPEI